jgi:hypothetical protein
MGGINMIWIAMRIEILRDISREITDSSTISFYIIDYRYRYRFFFMIF